jgi:hypothetical protein
VHRQSRATGNIELEGTEFPAGFISIETQPSYDPTPLLKNWKL